MSFRLLYLIFYYRTNVLHFVQLKYFVLCKYLFSMQSRRVPQVSHPPRANVEPLGTALTGSLITSTVGGVSTDIGPPQLPRFRTLPNVTTAGGNFRPENFTITIQRGPIATMTTSTGVVTSTFSSAPRVVMRMPKNLWNTAVTTTNATTANVIPRASLHKGVLMDPLKGPTPNLVTTTQFRALASSARQIVSTVVPLGSSTSVTWANQPAYNQPMESWSNPVLTTIANPITIAESTLTSSSNTSYSCHNNYFYYCF